MLLRYPLMTLKVVAAIHFEAVRLMLKGMRRHPHRPKAAIRPPSSRRIRTRPLRSRGELRWNFAPRFYGIVLGEAPGFGRAEPCPS